MKIKTFAYKKRNVIILSHFFLILIDFTSYKEVLILVLVEELHLLQLKYRLCNQ